MGMFQCLVLNEFKIVAEFRVRHEQGASITLRLCTSQTTVRPCRTKKPRSIQFN